MPHTLIPCRFCSGAGKVQLKPHLETTLALFKKGVRLHAEEVKTRLKAGDVTTSAMNGRLEDLRSMGFLERVRVGKFWIYQRTKPKQENNDDPTIGGTPAQPGRLRRGTGTLTQRPQRGGRAATTARSRTAAA